MATITMRPDNTIYMGSGASYSTPMSYLRQSGLAGIGLVPYDPSNPYNQVDSVAYGSDTSIADTTTAAVTALNSEAVFLENLRRSIQGLPPLDPRVVSPSVNFGLTADAKQTIMVAGLGILALFMLAKPARTSRRSLRRRRFRR